MSRHSAPPAAGPSLALRRTALLLALGALGAALSSCESFSTQNTHEMMADVSEFLGASNPSRHVERLDALHDWGTFGHRPDLPPTEEACVEEVRILAKSDYESWREVALATFFMTRVAAEDPAALNRGEAVAALERMGRMVQEAEDPPAAPAGDDATAKALKRLKEIHDPEVGLHVAPEAVGECRDLVLAVGDFRMPLRPGASEADMRHDLLLLRGTLLVVVGETRCGEAHASAEARSSVDRAVVNLAAQAVRRSLAVSLRYDPEAPVRAAAARVVGALGGEAAAESLSAAYVKETMVPVRREILGAVGRLVPRRGADLGIAVPMLLAALDDDDESVGFNAREILRGLAGQDLGPKAAPWTAWWAREQAAGGR